LNKLVVFVIRLILGAIFAVILTRFFYPKAGIVFIVGAGIALVGLAYITEYVRIKGRDSD
jgi:tryptophan-rich sensory protein